VNLQHEQTSDLRVFTVPILVGSAVAAGAAPAAGRPAAQPPDAAHRGS
jgi:hypothetical protein